MKEKQPNEFASPVFKKRFARRTTTYRPFTFVRNFETQSQPQNQIVKQVGDRGVVISSPVTLQAASDGTSITDIVRQSPVPVIIAHTAPDPTNETEQRVDDDEDDAQDFAVTPRRSRRSHDPSPSFLSRLQYPTGTPKHGRAHKPDEHYIGSQNDSNIDEEISFVGDEDDDSENKSSASARSSKQLKGTAGAEKSITKEVTSAKRKNKGRNTSAASSSSLSVGEAPGTGGKQTDDQRGSSQMSSVDSQDLTEKKTPAHKEVPRVVTAVSATSMQSRQDSSSMSGKGRKRGRPRKNVQPDSSTLDGSAGAEQEAETTETLAPTRKGDQLHTASETDMQQPQSKKVSTGSDNASSTGRRGRPAKTADTSRSASASKKSQLAQESSDRRTENIETAAPVVDHTSSGRRVRRQQTTQNSSSVQDLSVSARSASSSVAQSTRKRAARGNQVTKEGEPSGKKARASKTEDKQREVSVDKDAEKQSFTSSSLTSRGRSRTDEGSVGSSGQVQVSRTGAGLTETAKDHSSLSYTQPKSPEKSSTGQQGGQRRFFTDPERRTPQKLKMQSKVALRKPARKGTPQASNSFWKTRKVISRQRERQLDVSMSSVYDDETFGEDEIDDASIPSKASEKDGRWSRVQRQLQGRSTAAQLEKQARKRQTGDITELDVIADILEETEMESLENLDVSSACRSAVHKEFTFVRKQMQQTMAQVAEIRELMLSIRKLKGRFRASSRESRENHQQKCLLLKELQSLKKKGVDADMMRIDTWLQDFQALRQLCSRPSS